MALYDRVLDIAREYMGPAATDYTDRRIMSMRIANPKEIAHEHLDTLALTVRATAKVYMTDEMAAKFQTAILELKKGR